MFVDELIRFDDLLLFLDRIDNRLATDASDNARGQIDNFLVALVNGTNRDAVHRSAIIFVDDHVLRGIHQFAGEITGVRRFQRGIGQTLARTVRRDEIFEHAQTFAEIRSDRALDDFAARLRHQTAHAGELTHLLTIAARAGIHHQVNRIQFLAALVVFEGAEHDVGDFVTGVRPDVDDLVVTLAVRDDALAILLLDRFDLFVSVFEFGLLLFRNDHVRNSDRNTGLGRFAEAELLEFIKRLDRPFLARHLVTTPDNVAQLLLARSPIEKADVLWPNLIEEDAAGGGFDYPQAFVAINGIAAEIGVLESNAVMRFDRTFRHCEFDLDRIGK